MLTVELPEIILEEGFSDKNVLLELAISLYTQEKVSSGKAASIAGLPRIEFLGILNQRGIEVLNEEMLEQDLATLDNLKTS